MLFLPILAAKIDYVFYTAMGRLVLLKHCVSVFLWRFARFVFGKSSGTEYMEGQRHLFNHEQEPWQVMWQMVWSETVFFMWSTAMGIVHIGRKQSLTYWFGINEQNRLKNGICVILCPT